MPFTSRRAPLDLSPEVTAKLETIRGARTAPAQRVERARILLAYASGNTVSAIARALRTNRPKVERCLDKALQFGPLAALDDLQRSGRPPTITPEARAWLVSLACRKPTELGYAEELWTTRLLARHARQQAATAGHPSLEHLARGTVSKLLSRAKLRPHKITYYLERRDPEFDQKMAEVLFVYKLVEVLREHADGSAGRLCAFVSYDEKPGIQAIGSVAPDLPPQPGHHPAISRDYEYRRHGTLTLMAGPRPAHRPRSRRRRGPSPQSRVHRLPEAVGRRLPSPDPDRGHPGQSLGAYLPGNPGLSGHHAQSVRVHLYPHSRFLVEPDRDFLQQGGPHPPTGHPRRFQTGPQTAHRKLHGATQRRTHDPSVELQNGRLGSALNDIILWNRSTSRCTSRPVR